MSDKVLIVIGDATETVDTPPRRRNPRPSRLRQRPPHGHRAKCKFDLEVCGGIYVNQACVIDGNLVSGRTFHDNGKYFGAFMKLLNAATKYTASHKDTKNTKNHKEQP